MESMMLMRVVHAQLPTPGPKAAHGCISLAMLRCILVGTAACVDLLHAAMHACPALTPAKPISSCNAQSNKNLVVHCAWRCIGYRSMLHYDITLPGVMLLQARPELSCRSIDLLHCMLLLSRFRAPSQCQRQHSDARVEWQPR